MISFILYDDNKYMRDLYGRVAKKFLYTTEDCYKIHEFENFSAQTRSELRAIEGQRIYFINIDTHSMEGISMVKWIRERGDFHSPIILLTSKEKGEVIDNLQNLLFLNLIVQDDQLVQNIFATLREAYKIITDHLVYTFSIFDEIYRLPYNDICYIIKNIRDDSITIYTKDDTYLNYTSIKKLEKELEDDPRFFKIHRSCIINLYNVASYNKKDNVITFKNGATLKMTSKLRKKKLVERLKEFNTKL